MIEDDLKNRFNQMLNTGFPQWTLREYQTFIKIIKKKGFEDVGVIAAEIVNKTEAEVAEYMQEFLLRFRELKEKDIILKKVQDNDFDKRNLESIRDFQPSKSHVILMQDNNFFNHNAYLSTFE
jgi:hypothetical protein